ncbi:hypothetical protein ACLBXM_09220 [Xanthobacteraceae bacterium A53D]
MAITFPRPFPDGARLPLSRITLQRSNVGGTLGSGALQVMELYDPIWVGRFATEPLVWSRRRRWSAWGTSLGEGIGSFIAYDWLGSYPVAYGASVMSLTRAGGGAYDGTAVLNNWTSTTVTLTGLPAGYKATPSDRLSFPWWGVRAYHEVAEDAVASSAGVLTVTVQPQLRLGLAPTPGVTVDLVRAPIAMRLRPGTWSEPDEAQKGPVSFEGVQDLSITI